MSIACVQQEQKLTNSVKITVVDNKNQDNIVKLKITAQKWNKTGKYPPAIRNGCVRGQTAAAAEVKNAEQTLVISDELTDILLLLLMMYLMWLRVAMMSGSVKLKGIDGKDLAAR